MPHRDVAFLPQAVEDAETLRLGDVLQVHAAERGRDELHRLDDLLRVLRGERDREGVDPAQIFEQESLALHDREAGLWADVPEAEDPRAVRHDGNLVPFVRQAPDQLRVRLDVEARLSHAGRVPDREVVEAPDGDPRDHFDLPLVVRMVLRGLLLRQVRSLQVLFHFLCRWRFDGFPFRALLRDHLDTRNRIAG